MNHLSHSYLVRSGDTQAPCSRPEGLAFEMLSMPRDRNVTNHMEIESLPPKRKGTTIRKFSFILEPCTYVRPLSFPCVLWSSRLQVRRVACFHSPVPPEHSSLCKEYLLACVQLQSRTRAARHPHPTAQRCGLLTKQKHGKWEMKHPFYFHTSKWVTAKDKLKNNIAILCLSPTF